MDIDEPILGDDIGDPRVEQLPGASAIQPADTMDDQRLGLGEAFGQCLGEKQVLGGAGAATLAQHPLHAAVTRTAISQRPHCFDQVE